MLEENCKKCFLRRKYFKDNKKSVKPIMRLRCALSIKIFLWKRSKGSANRLVRAKTDLIKNTKAKSVSNFSRRKFSSWNSSFSIHQKFSSLRPVLKIWMNKRCTDELRCYLFLDGLRSDLLLRPTQSTPSHFPPSLLFLSGKPAHTIYAIYIRTHIIYKHIDIIYNNI